MDTSLGFPLRIINDKVVESGKEPRCRRRGVPRGEADSRCKIRTNASQRRKAARAGKYGGRVPIKINVETAPADIIAEQRSAV